MPGDIISDVKKAPWRTDKVERLDLVLSGPDYLRNPEECRRIGNRARKLDAAIAFAVDCANIRQALRSVLNQNRQSKTAVKNSFGIAGKSSKEPTFDSIFLMDNYESAESGRLFRNGKSCRICFSI